MPGPGPKPPCLTRRRLYVRGCVLALAVGFAWPWRPDAWHWTSLVLPATSPFVAVGSTLAARDLGWLSALAFPFLLLAWGIPRVLCRYVCPVGLLQENVARLRRGPHHAWRRFPASGVWLAAATLGAAALGYPLFLWLDPYAIFHSGLNAWRTPLTVASLLVGATLPALLLLELAVPQLWCQRLCPLGGTQDLLSRLRRWTTRLTRRHPPPPAWIASRGRRTFLAAVAGAAGAVAAKSVRSQPPALRPPGALPEDMFTGVCVRCGNCAQVCPSHIIQPDLAGSLTGLLAPRLNFTADFCRESCHRCGQVCPSRAITRLALPDKRRAVIGEARVDLETCLMALGKECNACVQGCPYEAVSIASGADGFSSQPRVDPTRCNGCGACEAVCPVRPTRAIAVHATLGVRTLAG
jgi:ferredoxin-type protein NapF